MEEALLFDGNEADDEDGGKGGIFVPSKLLRWDENRDDEPMDDG